MCEFAVDERKRLPDHLGVALLAGELVARKERTRDFGVVIEHLLEVWHRPVRVDAVAMEAAADVVIEAARRHRLERFLEHVAILVVPRSVVRTREHLQSRRLWELRPAGAKAAVPAIRAPDRRVGDPLEDVTRGWLRIGDGIGCLLESVFRGVGPLFRAVFHLWTVVRVRPRLTESLTELEKAGLVLLALFREVGADENGFPSGVSHADSGQPPRPETS